MTPGTTPDLTERTIALLATDGVEQVELTGPKDAFEAAGATVHLIAPSDGTIQGYDHLTEADEHSVDRTVAEANPSVYDALVLPGGVANPDELRTDADAVGFARSFLEAGKPVAAICHAPWLLIEADAVSGRRITSWPSLATDLRNAGATWIDEEVVVCTEGGPGPLVTSRNPGDIPAFVEATMDVIANLPRRTA